MLQFWIGKQALGRQSTATEGDYLIKGPD